MGIMRLEVFTLALDAMPWLPMQLATFNRLPAEIDWRWTVVHGVAQNVKDTGWMKSQQPRLSNDGTTEFLGYARLHPRVHVLENTNWPGKTAMCNAALEGAHTPCVLLEVDADEIWTPDQIVILCRLFEANPDVAAMQFWCRYFLGFNIVAHPRTGHSYGCRQNEWMRAWRMADSGDYFGTHEPPIFRGTRGRTMGRDETLSYGLEFDHYAYATRKQLEYKEAVYGYPGAVSGWERLQLNKNWPTKLKTFLPWVDDAAMADQLLK